MTVPWDAGLYAQNTAHHRAFDGRVLAGLSLPADGRILDVGCGVGDLTARLAVLVPDGLTVGVDPEPGLLAVARERHALPGLEFRQGRAQELVAAAGGGPYDLVVSTAALHWVPREDHPAFLVQARSLLAPHGALRLELGGQGQIAAARAVLDEVSVGLGGPVSPWYFPSVSDYRPLLVDAGLAVQTCRLVRQRRSVPDRPALAGWLRSQVLIAYRPGFADDGAYTAFCRQAESEALLRLRRDDGTYDQDYVRLEVRAVAGSASDGPDLFEDLSQRLRAAHRRLRALEVPDERKAQLTRRLLAISDAAKHDLSHAARRLDALENELDTGSAEPPGP